MNLFRTKPVASIVGADLERSGMFRIVDSSGTLDERAIGAFKGTDADPSLALQRMEKLANKVEALLKELQDQNAAIAQLRGSMNLRTCPDPAAYERANYVHSLLFWDH